MTAVFEHILKKLNAQPEDCVFTDDNPKYVDAANKLGIHGIVFTGTESFKREFEQLATVN